MTAQLIPTQWGASIIWESSATQELQSWMENVSDCVNGLTSGTTTTVTWANITGNPEDSTSLVAFLDGNYIGIGDAAGGDLTGTYPNPELIDVTTAGGGVRPVVEIDAKGRVTALTGEVIRVLDADYVTIGNEVLLLSKNVTVTLNPSPVDLEQVRIKAAKSGGFTVKSSINMDGQKSIVYRKSYIERNYIYSSELGEWRVF